MGRSWSWRTVNPLDLSEEFRIRHDKFARSTGKPLCKSDSVSIVLPSGERKGW